MGKHANHDLRDLSIEDLEVWVEAEHHDMLWAAVRLGAGMLDYNVGVTLRIFSDPTEKKLLVWQVGSQAFLCPNERCAEIAWAMTEKGLDFRVEEHAMPVVRATDTIKKVQETIDAQMWAKAAKGVL